jgi:hypothetical protein
MGVTTVNEQILLETTKLQHTQTLNSGLFAFPILKPYILWYNSEFNIANNTELYILG